VSHGGVAFIFVLESAYFNRCSAVGTSNAIMISGGGLSVGLVVLRSLTKFFVMPGLRVAYAVAHPETRVAIEAFVPAWPVDSIAAEAARLALQGQASIAATREINARERGRLADRLSGRARLGRVGLATTVPEESN
jgi:histidinol-phosphate/aromatic aminotransferase/cobyric acid decarboxylase-like protein